MWSTSAHKVPLRVMMVGVLALTTALVQPVYLHPVSAQDQDEVVAPEPDVTISPQDLSLNDLFEDPNYVSPDVLAAVSLNPLAVGIDEFISYKIDFLESEIELDEATSRLSRTGAAISAQAVVVEESAQTQAAASAELDRTQNNLSTFAIAAFSTSELQKLHTFKLSGKFSPQHTLQRTAEDRIIEIRNDASDVLIAADAQLLDERNTLSDYRAQELVAQADMMLADTELDLAMAGLDRTADTAERRVVASKDPVLGFSISALDAYYNAEKVMAEADPTCGIEWWQLAGVGRVESVHGTFGGARVSHNGTTTRRIFGPPLTGEEFAEIHDTDGGQLDNDPVWDRAVGPMQFIPTSWKIFRADGNGDGNRNPHNMYDATVAAGKHLCGSVRDITADGRFTRALLGYNGSVEYGIAVQEFAEQYVEQIDLVVPPYPTTEEQIVCQPKPDKPHSLKMIGCGSIGGSGGLAPG